MNHGEGPTRDGGDHQCNRGDEDEPLVRRRIEAGPEGEKDQRRKNQHIRDGNDVKNFRIHVWIAVTANERIGGRQYSKDYHETRQEEACNAEAAMDVHAAGGNQRGLRHEQEDPAGKCRPVQVNDQAGQRRLEHSCEVVSARKTHKNRCQDKQGHRRKE